MRWYFRLMNGSYCVMDSGNNFGRNYSVPEDDKWVLDALARYVMDRDHLNHCKLDFYLK